MFRRRKLEEDATRLAMFRWRGGDVSRLEGFSDAVFAFALTLLVVSLEVPTTFQQLRSAMREFFAFGICFALLYAIWYRHYLFFRRYGLHDGWTIVLNGMLMFVLLFYVYPLKFVFSMLIGMISGHNSLSIQRSEVPTLFLIYGAGFVAVYGLFALLHWNAFSKRKLLELDEFEQKTTKMTIYRELCLAAVGLVSGVLALVLPLGMAGFSGFAYFLVSPVEGIFGAKEASLRRQFSGDASSA